MFISKHPFFLLTRDHDIMNVYLVKEAALRKSAGVPNGTQAQPMPYVRETPNYSGANQAYIGGAIPPGGDPWWFYRRVWDATKRSLLHPWQTLQRGINRWQLEKPWQNWKWLQPTPTEQQIGIAPLVRWQANHPINDSQASPNLKPPKWGNRVYMPPEAIQANLPYQAQQPYNR